MLKYAKIINQKNKQCEVGLGTNIVFYKKIGMTELDVVQSYDGNWYLKGYVPQKSLETLKREKIQELKTNCSAFIYSKYPIYKQLNVANGLATKKEIEEMKDLIQKTRLLCNNKESLIEKAESIELLKKIIIDF